MVLQNEGFVVSQQPKSTIAIFSVMIGTAKLTLPSLWLSFLAQPGLVTGAASMSCRADSTGHISVSS